MFQHTRSRFDRRGEIRRGERHAVQADVLVKQVERVAMRVRGERGVAAAAKRGLKRALETSDADHLLGLYDEQAELAVVDRHRPPSAPLRIVGKPAIAAFWRDICAREMTHRVANEVLGPDRLSFVEECLYPDGCRVMSAMVLDLDGGRIRRHLTIQAWDEVSCTA